MELLLGFLIWAGPLGIVGGFILLMIKKAEWKWPQVITAFIFAMLVASAAPAMPQAVNDGLNGIVQSASK